MNPDRWQAIGDLFDQALAVPAGDRTALIDEACGSDEVVRREVRSLLVSHDAVPGGFVQKRIDAAHPVIQPDEPRRHAGARRAVPSGAGAWPWRHGLCFPCRAG